MLLALLLRLLRLELLLQLESLLRFPYLQTMSDLLQLQRLPLLRQEPLLRRPPVRRPPVQWRRRIQARQSPGSKTRRANIGHWRFSKRRLRHCASYGSLGRRPTKPAQSQQAQFQVYLV